MLSDIEIASQAKMKRIGEIAANLGISEEDLEPYGHYKAKLSESLYTKTKDKEDGKLILVTAINPTPAGEGKTTISVGLEESMSKIGKKAILALREPSLGPVFGIKGGAEVRASTAKGADFAFPVLADKAGSYIDFRTFHGLFYASVGFFLIVLYNKFSGVKPLGIEAFLLQFCGKDGGGKKFPKGNLLFLWCDGKFTEKAVNPGLDFVPFLSGKKAFHYVLMAFLHLGNCLGTAVQESIRAAADGAGNKYHRTFIGLLFNYIQDPGHSRCAGYGTAAKL